MATLLAKIANLTGVGKSLLVGDKTQIGEVLIDATHLEEIHYSNVITDHSVSAFNGLTGSSVSDHCYKNPTKLRVTGSITEDSVNVVGLAATVIDLFNGDVLTNISNKYKGKGRNQIVAYQILTDLYSSGNLIDVVFFWDSFQNMIIEDLKFPKDKNTGNRLYFEAILKQVTFATVKTVSISRNSKPTQDLVSGKIKYGSQETLEPTPTQVQKGITFYKSIKTRFQALGGS
jgi:hypothetical protein